MKDNNITTKKSILDTLLEQVVLVDFVSLAFPEAKRLREELAACDPKSDRAVEICKKLDKFRVNERHHVIFAIEAVAALALKNKWGLCRNQNRIYLYNGEYWTELDRDTFQKFLLNASERMGVPIVSSKYFHFGEKLFRQFMMQLYLPTPACDPDVVLINLLNGTYEIRGGKGTLREFRSGDFLTYQLPFRYDSHAEAPIFDEYLETVLPDDPCRNVLAEYVGSLFIKTGNSMLKEEKALLLYGTGANGKSVFFSVVNALLGPDNVTYHSLQDITNESGYYRAQLANRLLNYSSEINGKLESSLFKQLVSGEPVTARLPYGNPFIITQYARLIFNCNELPKDVEHTEAYFRRFLIIPFGVTIPKERQDKNLHNKIIGAELAGVFNWVLRGLGRLLRQGEFSECDAARKAVDDYRLQSDSVRQFLDENAYRPHPDRYLTIPLLYGEYKDYCVESGFFRLTKPNFIKRLRAAGVQVRTINIGNVAYLERSLE